MIKYLKVKLNLPVSSIPFHKYKQRAKKNMPNKIGHIIYLKSKKYEIIRYRYFQILDSISW
ncbi:MAG: hypothetical protein IBX66_04455 [Lutibacter sp.]|nr:hypothetical protein [Lutibacter sp.]